jgi:hypothetical protein
MSVFSNIEEEVVLLNAIHELIDSMVNFEMLSLTGDDPRSQISFKSSIHQQLFNVLLVDFLSQTDKRSPIQQTSYCGALKFITTDPSFNWNNSVESLRRAIQQFAEWLDQEVEIEVWLPSIEAQTILNISRMKFLKMCGNICKHNFLRSIGIAKDLQERLAASGVSITLNDALPALEEFYRHFGADIFQYHSSRIAEFLNNIRWGIYDYLRPEFRRSFTPIPSEPPRYEFKYPSGLTAKFAKDCYWNLMNDIRSQPYVRRFEVTKSKDKEFLFG